MDKYTIHCTPEQTKKALELGAPIKPRFELFTPYLKDTPHCHISIDGEDVILFIPTAEQMIGWLEEQMLMFNISTNPFDEFKVIVSKAGGYDNIANIKWNKSRKEATLAAIDAALEYLIQNKK